MRPKGVPAYRDELVQIVAPGACGSAKMLELPNRPGKAVQVNVTTFEGQSKVSRTDRLATEEPMEIRAVTHQGKDLAPHPVSVTMRTPGNDFELAAGFLFTEGAIKSRGDIERISYCTDPKEAQNYNVVNVFLAEGVHFDAERLSRHVYTTSSCGVCGKASLELVRASCPVKPVGDFKLTRSLLALLPDKLREAQSIFSKTGGLHASALFDSSGKLLALREDVGRHNALDKVVGNQLLEGKTPAPNTVMVVSGRTSFEIVQKAAMLGVPIMAAVGAPSSLAVQLAEDYGMTLIGFLRGNRFNVYCNGYRLRGAGDAS